MKNLKEAFGLRLKELRKSNKYTQEVLAEMIDLSPRQLIRIENGENFPSAETIGKISLILNISLDHLFDFNWNEDIMYFPNGVYSKPSLNVLKKGDYFIIKSLSQVIDDGTLKHKPLNKDEYEEEIFNLCRKQNRPLTVEFFENKKRISIKTFSPNRTIEEVLTKENILNNDIYNYILTKLKKNSSNYDKLNYIKIAIDSLEDKESLKKLSSIIQGMNLVLKH